MVQWQHSGLITQRSMVQIHPPLKNQFSYDCGLEAQNVMMWYMRIPRELDKVKNSQTLTTVVIREKRGEAVTVD